MSDKILVDKDALQLLLEESTMLTALIGVGVDNWEGWDEGLSVFFDSKNDLIADFYERYTEGEDNVK